MKGEILKAIADFFDELEEQRAAAEATERCRLFCSVRLPYADPDAANRSAKTTFVLRRSTMSTCEPWRPP